MQYTTSPEGNWLMLFVIFCFAVIGVVRFIELLIDIDFLKLRHILTIGAMMIIYGILKYNGFIHF